MISDVGSLLYLGEKVESEDSLYVISSYTERFASMEYIMAVKNRTPLTREQLIREDKH
jgi:hypothetical protein